jgi:cellulose biosynthesis protein BcsQ
MKGKDMPVAGPINKHMDEAKLAAIGFFRRLIAQNKAIERMVLIEDIFGWLRTVIWLKEGDKEALFSKVNEELKAEASPYWSEEIYFASSEGEAGNIFYQSAWDEGVEDNDCSKLRIAGYRSRGSWLRALTETPWKVGAKKPPILVFYSFKGGVGRSTALAAFAIQRARMGERVVVIDFDLDAPGAGVLLAADENGTTALWGVLDYMLERPYGKVTLDDYLHVCRRETVTGTGEIIVFPAAQVDDHYLSKLSRMDFELPTESGEKHPLIMLLEQIRVELNPSWVLIDSRAGLSETAGFLLGGLAHMYVIFGTTSEQSWQGIRLIVKRLGAERVVQNKNQLDCLLIQAMVTSDKNTAETAIKGFRDRSEEEFRDYYYAPDPADPDEDRFWYVRDIDDRESPHYPLAIHYHQSLAHFDLIDKVADDLTTQDYKALGERIARKFGKSES